MYHHFVHACGKHVEKLGSKNVERADWVNSEQCVQSFVFFDISFFLSILNGVQLSEANLMENGTCTPQIGSSSLAEILTAPLLATERAFLHGSSSIFDILMSPITFFMSASMKKFVYGATLTP
jgi:hypothetical protein